MKCKLNSAGYQAAFEIWRKAVNGNRVILALLIMLTPMLLNCCSMIGLGIGTAIDKGTNPHGYEIGKIKPGAFTTVTLQDDSKIKGVYRGLDSIDNYDSVYTEVRNARWNGIMLPQLGDSVQIINNKEEKASLIFIGFTYRYRPEDPEIHHQTGAKQCSLLGKPEADNPPLEFSLDNIKRIRYDGGYVDGVNLAGLYQAGKIPLNTAAIFSINANKQTQIPLNNIKTINNKHTFSNIGLGLGLTADIIIMARIISRIKLDIVPDMHFGG